MDILTHLMIGAAVTSPFWPTHPLESVAFTLGSVLPDIDALSRQFGKVAYLRAHQGWTHAIPMHVLLGSLGVAILEWSGYSVFTPSIIALTAAAVLHVLLDWTNTWGVRLFAPFDNRRRSLEWVFFVDAWVLTLTAVTLAYQTHQYVTAGRTSLWLTPAWLAAMTAYFAAKGFLRAHAGRLVEDAVALVPDTFLPWRFHVTTRRDDTATTYVLDLFPLRRTRVEERAILDREWSRALDELPEFRAMRELSSGYHVVAADRTTLTCRDLRTRNFGTNFGRLLVAREGDRLTVERFDV